jgi:hypothetical protein
MLPTSAQFQSIELARTKDLAEEEEYTYRPSRDRRHTANDAELCTSTRLIFPKLTYDRFVQQP